MATPPRSHSNDKNLKAEEAQPCQATIEAERISRDERHLASYPIALLSYQAARGKTITQHRTVRHPLTKKPVQATWEILGSDKLGLPTPSDDAVIMVLMEISREQNFPREVVFSQYDVLKRLGWSMSQGDYQKLALAFERITATTIQSKNVFWNEQAKAYLNTGFHLIESYEIVAKKGRRKATVELPLSRFTWGEPIWNSFRDGNLKPIRLDFYLALHLPLARRLYRYLDLIRFDGKATYRIGLRKLCEEYLAVSPAKYPSIYKQTLQPAHEELVNAGYLADAYYEEAKSGDGDNVVYTFVAKEKFQALSTSTSEETVEEIRTAIAAADLIDPKAEEDARLDTLFETLHFEQQDRIRAEARERLPEFLRANLSQPVAKRTYQENIRQIVKNLE